MTPALRRGLLTAVVVAGLLAGGCSRAHDDTPGGGASSTSTRRSGGTEGTTTTVGPAGGTMRLGLGGPIVVDPVLASPASPSDQMVLDLLHDGLTRVDHSGRLRTDVAKDWTADAKATTWRFTIDPDATFSSGRPVNASDVVGSLQHVIAAGDTSLAALRLEPVQGFRAFLDGTAPSVTGLRAIDERTVQISLDTPLSTLPALLAAPAYGVVDLPSLSATAKGDLKSLALSGDWKVATSEPGRLVLQRRPGAPGRLDDVELRAFPTAAEAYADFEKGDVDWAPVPGGEVGAARQAYGADHLTPFQAELSLGLRVSTLPELGLRQAIAAAIDRSDIVKAIYPDLAEDLRTIVPAGIAGHDDDRCPTCGFDPAHAKALLALTYPDGKVPRVTIDYDASPAQQALARIVATDLEAVGIPTSLHPLLLADYQHYLVSGSQQVFALSWIGGDRTPDAYLTPLFRSDSPDNLVGLQSRDVDYLLGQARETTDPVAAAADWAQAERIVLEQAVVVPIAQFRIQVVVAPRVTGFADAVDGTVDWASVVVADGA